MAHDEDGAGDDPTPQAGIGALNYTDLPGLEDVYLEDSFVRQVAQDGGTLTFVLVAALRKGHPYFQAPRASERHCYRAATLIFREAEVKWRKRNTVSFVDKAGATDVGNIDTFVAPPEGGYHLEGEFGIVDIVRSRAPVFTVAGESPGNRTYRRSTLQRWVDTGDALGEGKPHAHDAPDTHDHAHDHVHAHPPGHAPQGGK